MKVQCKLCRGKGRIPDPKYSEGPMRICGMYGEQCLDLECEACKGTGWLDVSKKVMQEHNERINMDRRLM